MSEEIRISKVDAARRQLETAIVLFFQYGDSVSIHTLVRAAHEILETLCKTQGIQSITNWGLQFIKKEKHKEFREKMSEAKNFFKHAASDADIVLSFNPELSNFYLYDSVRLYQVLIQERTKVFVIFSTWFFMKYPEIISSEEQKRVFSVSAGLDLEDRELFFQGALKAFELNRF